MGEITDIVITSHNRPIKLRRVLAYIMARTRSPHRIHISDDGSEREVVDYLIELWRAGVIESLLLRDRSWGPHAVVCSGFWLAFSDPVVVIPDDVLVPTVDPDWLAQGLAAMERFPDLGILDLNNPSANLGKDRRRRAGPAEAGVQFCDFVGGAVAFARRSLMEAEPMVLSWTTGGFRRHRHGGTRIEVERGPWRKRVLAARRAGLRIGYLKSVYCQHIGTTSIRRGGKVLRLVDDVDPSTLEPREEAMRA